MGVFDDISEWIRYHAGGEIHRQRVTFQDGSGWDSAFEMVVQV